VARWTRQWQASKQADNPDIERLITWLPTNVPPDDETSIVHGDLRLGNLMFHSTEPRVVGLLDWELSTLGHPLADVGGRFSTPFPPPLRKPARPAPRP
jgi:aminoglycoside phosphotransferase (APT) family kinase protein